MTGSPPRLHLPYPDWPLADRKLWERAIADDDPFGDSAGGRLAPTSLRQYWYGWRRFLGFLALDEFSALDALPHERLTTERVRRFVLHLRETHTPQSVTIQVDALYKAARLMMRDHDWAWLKSMKARLYTAAPAHSARGPIITSLQLLDLGQQLMEETKALENEPLKRSEAVKFRDGLMIALLAFIPLRRKNLLEIQLGRHLINENENWILVISPAETKTGTHIEFRIPELLVPYLDTYLREMRPCLLRRQGCNSFWISHKGGPLSYSAIGQIVVRWTSARLGVRISPHDVRDAAATTWAVAAPNQIDVARDLLAQRHVRTTNKHYNRAKGIEASRAHAQILAEKRRGSPPDDSQCPL